MIIPNINIKLIFVVVNNKSIFFYIIIAVSSILNSCYSVKKNNKMNTNPLLCDPDSGVCEIPETNFNHIDTNNIEVKDKIKILYFTDPICSSCWGIEPQLRKLKLEYGHCIDIEYHMGGLLPDWSYNSGGISKPSDVASHWDEVSAYYQMPIDGDVWLSDPLHSSYPPSIAFKAAQLQDKTKALKFLRKLREMVFLQKINICKWEHISNAASQCQLDTLKLKTGYETNANIDFQVDLKLTAQLGVRGFPTLILKNNKNQEQIIYGFKPYQQFEQAILILNPEAKKKEYNKNKLFDYYDSYTAKEFSILKDININEAEKELNLMTSPKLKVIKTKNGNMWLKE